MTPLARPAGPGRDAPVRVVGVGSPFGADRLGWEAMDALVRMHALAGYPDGLVALHCLDRPGASLMELLRAPGLLILIDAMRSGRPPGTVRALDAADLEETRYLVSTHGFGIESALRLARALGESVCQVRIFGIEMDAIGAPDVEASRSPAREIERLASCINELIRNFLNEGSSLQEIVQVESGNHSDDNNG